MKKFTDKINESVENKISTAEEFWFKNTGQNINQEEYSAMVEFAKLHVEAALKEASEKATVYADEGGYSEFVDEQSILNAYPLDNIK
jgi:predicted AAA+ superfamily ATPase